MAMILDLMLPGMTGEELLSKIKKEHPEIPVIIASAKEDTGTRVSLLRAGAAVFVCGEYAGGAIKNIVGKGYGRGCVFLSKYLSAIVGAVIMELVMLGTILLCELLILHGNRLNGDLVLQLLDYVAIRLILAMAQTGIIVLINQISRSLGAGIAISVCLIMFSSFVTSLMTALLGYFELTIVASEYWIIDMISSCPVVNITGKIWGHNVLWSAVWIVLTIGIGILHYRKADVK